MLHKFLIVLFLFLPSHAWAQDEDENGRKIVYKQKTEIDFEGVDIEGVLQKPQSSLIIERRQASFNPLVKLREDFNDQIELNTDEVK